MAGKVALVTGASAGIGAAFVRELARRGEYDLIITARREDRLKALASEVSSARGPTGAPSVVVVPGDLSTPKGREALVGRIAGLGVQVDLLINNAGFGSVGEFVDTELEREHRMVEVNCQAVVHLMRAFLPGMVARRGGTVLNVASTAAFQPVPYLPVYSATKAFVLSLSGAVASELQGTGVQVLCLCPGPTESEFHLVAGLPEKMSHLPAMSAETVVQQALECVGTRRRVIVSGRVNRLLATLSRVLPMGVTADIARRVIRRGQEQ